MTNEIFKPCTEATAAAKRKEKENIKKLVIKQEFDFCLRLLVCPKCAGKLKMVYEETGPESYDMHYTCIDTVGGQSTTCGFKYTDHK